MDFKQRLKFLRTERGLSLLQLSKYVNYSDTALGRWENGQRVPNIDVLIKLASFFEVSTDYLLGLKDY